MILAAHVTSWVRLAAATAKGDLVEVADAWRLLPREHHRAGIEVILQTLLFAGFPRVINALRTVQALGVDATAVVGDEPPPSEWAKIGAETCAQIYGRAYEPLRERMRELHPLMDRWMIEMGYGRLLSRPGVGIVERELCAVIVLAGLDVAPQLESHLRGARAVGASDEAIGEVLQMVGPIWGESAQRAADALWSRILASKPKAPREGSGF